MFDIGFTELLLIGIVALVVIGPERMPKVARTAGAWIGRLNRYVAQVKQDIDRDMKLEELRKMQQDMKETAQRYEVMGATAAREAETAMQTTVEEGTGQISKVMQAMSIQDGGLAMQEWEKEKAEAATTVAEALPEQPLALAETATETALPPSPVNAKPTNAQQTPAPPAAAHNSAAG